MWRTHVNLWICFLLCGLWHGAAWNFVLWGAYQGVFLTLDRLFLVKALERCGALVATAATLAIIMVGWAIFRSPTIGHLGAFLAALCDWTRPGWPMALSPEVAITAAIGAIICLAPVTPQFGTLRQIYQRTPRLGQLGGFALCLLYVASVARAFAVAFRPFIYFRF
jgi:alginate O-acetyltransferase complex protein AlgI